MFQGLGDSRHNVATSRSNWNTIGAMDENYDELPALEPLAFSSSSSESLSSRETPSHNQLSSAPSPTATSRFSTIVSNRSQERVSIGLNEDDECELEDQGIVSEVVQEANQTSPNGLFDQAHRASGDREMIWRDYNTMQEISIPEAETYAFRGHVDQQTPPSESTNDENGLNSPSLEYERNYLEHDAEPPFVTDGRGRVVWSRMRCAHEAQVGTTPPPTPPQTTDASERMVKVRRGVREATVAAADDMASGFTTDGRGRVIWAGSQVRANADGSGSGEGEGGGISGEQTVGEGEGEEGPRRWFFGRVYDAMFS